jgi:hypothetical protein
VTPEQQRIVNEKHELDDKRTLLSRYLNDEKCEKLDEAEQDRLFRQYAAMTIYSDILGERIEAFRYASS